MGAGFSVWDLIGRPSGGGVDPEEEERKRRQAQMFEPADDVPELEPLEEPQVIQAPQILGTEAHETSDILGQYKDWMSRRPTEDQYKPSVGRRILGGLAGLLTQNPGIANDIVYGKYKGAKREWGEEGKTLGEVGKFAQDVSETRRQRESDVLGFEGTQNRLEVQRSGIDQRREAENLRHNDRMTAATGDNERRQEIARHNKELEKIAGESNRIRGVEAATGQRTAATGEKNVGLREKELELKANAPGRPKPAHYRQTVNDVIGELLPSHPEMVKLLKFDKGTGKWTVRQPTSGVMGMGAREVSPQDMNNLKFFMEKARKRADEILGTGGRQAPEDEEAVDDLSPMLREDY